MGFMKIFDIDSLITDIGSKKHMMDLRISPSFSTRLVVKFHEMKDGSLQGFYIFEPMIFDVSWRMKDKIGEESVMSSASLEIIRNDEVFKSQYSPKAFYLNALETKYVNDLYNNGLPDDVEKSMGLDGHTYELWIYKNDEEKYYRAWCFIPPEWEKLSKLLSIVKEKIVCDDELTMQYPYF